MQIECGETELVYADVMGYETAGAEFDRPDRVYRYRLFRLWGGGSLSVWRTVLWIMLNPSTADERVLDPTLRKCQRFTENWGYDGFEIVNLFALRSTDPKGLYKHAAPVGPENDRMIVERADEADLVVCAWGSEKIAVDRAARVRRLLGPDRTLSCLGRSKNTGQPKHPLYLPYSTPLQEFR